MFVSDHRRDFDTALAATEPFALVRFGDGEAAILDGTKHKAANAEWTVEGPHWLRVDLHASLIRNAPGYCIGLPPNCCLPTIMHLHKVAIVPPAQRTLATLFLHGNLHRMVQLRQALDPVLVGTGLDIDVPHGGMDHGAVDLDGIVGRMMDADRSMLVAAGPLANVIIDRYWQRQEPGKRQIVLDVGSALDVALHGRQTRTYHAGAALQHHCTLNAAPLVAGQAARAPLPNIARRGPMITTRSAASTVHRAPVAVGGTRVRAGGTTVVRTSGAAAAPAAPNPAPATTPGSATSISAGPRRKCSTCLKVIRNRK